MEVLLNKYVMSLKTNSASVPFNFGKVNKDLINLSLTLANTRVNTSLRFVLTCTSHSGMNFYFWASFNPFSS